MRRSGFVAAALVLALAACTDDEPAAKPPAGEAEECVVGGAPLVRVPDVRGMILADALSEMHVSSLTVIGNGVAEGDPGFPTAVVRAQEPPAGALAPEGACVGFRTEDPN